MDDNTRGNIGAALIVAGLFTGIVLAGLTGLGLIYLAVLITGWL
jgi:hypothetical protein